MLNDPQAHDGDDGGDVQYLHLLFVAIVGVLEGICILCPTRFFRRNPGLPASRRVP